MSRGAAFALAVSLSCAAVSGSAWADPTSAEKSAAQALFEDARKLAAESRWARACPKLAESQRLDPSMGTQFYLAECYERTGRIATAWTHYLEVADAARAMGLADRDRYARTRAEALRQRLPRLAVKVSEEAPRPSGFEVTRDGVKLRAALWAASIPVDPGEHVIVASAPGKKRWTRTVSVAEAASLEVTIPALEDDHASETKLAPAPSASPRAAFRVAGFVAGGVGLVGLGVGAGFGVAAIDKMDASNSGGHCDTANTCDAIGKGLRRDSLRAATVSTIAFVAGGVAVAGGAVLLLVAPKDARGAAGGATLALDVGPGSVSLGGRW